MTKTAYQRSGKKPKKQTPQQMPTTLPTNAIPRKPRSPWIPKVCKNLLVSS